MKTLHNTSRESQAPNQNIILLRIVTNCAYKGLCIDE